MLTLSIGGTRPKT